MKKHHKKIKKSDLDFYPKSLLNEASEVLGDQFNRLPRRIRTGYIQTFYSHNGLIRHNQHNKDPDSFVFGREEIERNFTSHKDFNAVNHRGYYLRPKENRYGVVDNQFVLELKEVEGATKYNPTNWTIRTTEAFQSWREGGIVGSRSGYRLSPIIHKLIEGWDAKSAEELGDDVGFINHKGESILDCEIKFGGAIYRDKSNTPNGVNVYVQVGINKQSLAHHKEQLEVVKSWLIINKIDTLEYKGREWKEVSSKVLAKEKRRRTGRGGWGRQEAKKPQGGVNRDTYLQSLFSKDITLEGVKQRLVEIRTLLNRSREMQTSSIPIIYTEVSTGRYTTKGAVLQGYHKSVRYAALKSCYEYDLEAAHQNILIQLLDQQNSSFPELDVVREYVVNKKKVRQRLAKELITTVPIVKEIIQALTYGAQLSRSPKQSMSKCCKDNKALIERVVTNDWLKQLAKTFKLAHKHLIDDNNKIVNIVGIEFDHSKRSGKSSEMAHILQGYERLVLDSIIKHSNREDIALLVHDCVVFYNKQSASELSRIVKEETGFELEFSEEQY